MTVNIIKNTIAILIILIFSCKENNTTANKDKLLSNEDFASVYNNFFTSIIENNDITFDKFIHPKYGLYIITSSGALPEIKHLKSISEFKNKDGKSFFSLDKEYIGTGVIYNKLPKIDCDKKKAPFYDKEGAFTQDTNLLKNSEIWKFINASNEEKKQIEAAIYTIRKTVVNTANYVYYFSLIDGYWYISFIDMRQPCTL